MSRRQDSEAEQQLAMLLRIVHEEVNRLTARMPSQTYEREELVSCAFVGLCEARNRFDPSHGVPLGAYARLRIRGSLIDGMRNSIGLVRRRYFERFVRQQNTHASAQSLQAHLCSLKRDIVRGQQLEAIPLVPDELLLAKERIQLVRRALEALEDDGRLLIKNLFGFDGSEENGESLAQQLDCHRSSISRRKRKLLKHLKVLMSEPTNGSCAPRLNAHQRRPGRGLVQTTARQQNSRSSPSRCRDRRLSCVAKRQGKTPRSL